MLSKFMEALLTVKKQKKAVNNLDPKILDEFKVSDDLLSLLAKDENKEIAELKEVILKQSFQIERLIEASYTQSKALEEMARSLTLISQKIEATNSNQSRVTTSLKTEEVLVPPPTNTSPENHSHLTMQPQARKKER